MTQQIHPVVRGRSLAAEVATRLARIIESGAFAPGQRLPPEHALTSQFNVSRSVLREAVAALRADGLLASRRGSGVYVSAEGPKRPFRVAAEDLDAIPGILKVLELRAAIEIEAAGLAATRRTLAQARAITAAFDRIDEDAHRGASGADTDFAFHMAIAAATGNAQFTSILSYLRALLIPRQRIRIQADPAAGRDAYVRMLQREHRDIEQAIWAGDPVGAREAMRVHLVDGAQRYRRWAEEAALELRQPIVDGG
ncbi:MAG: FadR family transcriptional regulator [Planctomycetes bacterium]|nr:FadR family transcriptional regulator [Planctomycetota bacterium]